MSLFTVNVLLWLKLPLCLSTAQLPFLLGTNCILWPKEYRWYCTDLGKLFTSLEENINSYIVSRNPVLTQKNSSSSERDLQVAASHMDTIFGVGWITGNVNFFKNRSLKQKVTGSWEEDLATRSHRFVEMSDEHSVITAKHRGTCVLIFITWGGRIIQHIDIITHIFSIILYSLTNNMPNANP